MTDRRFRNGERVLHISPGAGWAIDTVTGEAADGGVYIGDRKIDPALIAGAIPDAAAEAELLAQMQATREKRQASVADARKMAWDAYWDALETAAVQRVPGILPTF